MGRRDEEREYRGDVTYDVWRSGGNVDRINDDRVSDAFYDGMSHESAASRELRHMRPSGPELEEQYEEQQYPDEPEPDGTVPPIPW